MFSRPGRYSYYCAPHPWMKGTVVVVAARDAGTYLRRGHGGADAVSSTTAAPAPAATSTTFPPSLAAPATTAPAETATTAAADTRRRPPPPRSRRTSAAPASSEKGSGEHLAGTLAVVLLPTLGGLALGAKLRRSTSD